SSRSDAESLAQKIQIEVEQSGSGVRVRTVYPDEERSWMHLGKRTSYTVNYDIALPSDAPLEVKNSFGNVTASNVRARSDIDNGHGSHNVRDSAPARLTNSFGSIDLTGAAGDVSVTDNNGTVEVADIKGAL